MPCERMIHYRNLVPKITDIATVHSPHDSVSIRIDSQSIMEIVPRRRTYEQAMVSSRA